MPRAAPVIAMVLPRMLSMRPNFTRVKFWLEVPLAGNSGAMATVVPELAYAMTVRDQGATSGHRRGLDGGERRRVLAARCAHTICHRRRGDCPDALHRPGRTDLAVRRSRRGRR